MIYVVRDKVHQPISSVPSRHCMSQIYASGKAEPP